MALPLLNVLMPSNVLLVQDVLLKIVNFEFIDKEAVYEEVVEPILADDEESEQTNNKNYLGSSSLLKAILLYVLIFIIVSLLITILVVCEICLLPKCCACFQKVAMFALGKLMFNSLLRAMMQSFFFMSLAMFTSFKST